MASCGFLGPPGASWSLLEPPGVSWNLLVTLINIVCITTNIIVMYNITHDHNVITDRSNVNKGKKGMAWHRMALHSMAWHSIA